MLRFQFATVGGSELLTIEPADTEGILRSMQSRPTWDGVAISPIAELGPDGEGQFPFLNLSWHPDHGYVVQCFETASSESDFLISSPQLSSPEVYIDLGGQTQELWPPQLFVPLDLAYQALRYLLESAHQDPGLQWIGVGAFPRLTVAPRQSR